jgi:peptidoglycan hydrolase CwlO-like protein
MGKHDMAEAVNPVLERHYQEQIRELERKVKKMQTALSDANAMIEQLRFHIEADEKKIDEYRNALVEQTLLATARKR